MVAGRWGAGEAEAVAERVLLEPLQLGEGAGAGLAAEGSLARVGAHVGGHVVLEGEAHGAQVAAEGLLARVHHLVPLEVPPAGRHVVARLALEAATAWAQRRAARPQLRAWLASACGRAKRAGHVRHAYGRSPVCRRRWVVTLCLAVKRAWHTGQWYRRSPVCVTWWRCTRYRSGAVYGHRLHCHSPADNCRQPATAFESGGWSPLHSGHLFFQPVDSGSSQETQYSGNKAL